MVNGSRLFKPCTVNRKWVNGDFSVVKCALFGKLVVYLHRQIQNNEEDGSNNDRPEEADFENNGVGFVSQVDD